MHDHAHDHDHGHDHDHEHAHEHDRRRGHDHAHHHHDHRTTPLRRLVAAFALTASFMFVEAAVGWWSNSLALVADAGHMLADAAAL
ncbi:MAG: cation transporter, partial [Myxococcota bacterium]